MSEPMYSSEFVDGCEEVLRRFLLPLVTQNTTAEQFNGAARQFRGHYMAKAVLETALLDHQLRAQGVSLATFIGATKTRVPSGVSVGIQPSIDDLLRVVQGYLDDGYLRIKLKIEPGCDIEPVRAVRRTFGDTLLLQVDANSAYSVNDARHLAQLDEFNLLLIEQPLPEEQVASHAELAKIVRTPICLDESVVSVEVAREALDIGACSIINIKPGRVGGYLEAKKIHDLCYERGVAVWCGGMLETGIGRAANLALAAMPGFTLPGDTSASARYFHRDVTTPFVLRDGHLDVPTGPGIGIDPDLSYLDSITSRIDALVIAR
jgi:O-succinylbenzoate synthase